MSMEEFRNLYWRQLEIRLGGIAGKLTRVSCFSREAWRPSAGQADYQSRIASSL